jgi:hypothetical protein
MKKPISREFLYQRYVLDKKNPYEIAEEISVNHKTVRSYLKKHNIPLRSASEYNFLAHKNYEKPSDEELFSALSIAAHTAYLCEGWHTEKSNYVSFCNQDPQLINLITKCLKDIYKAKSIKIIICGPTKESCFEFLKIYPEARIQIDKSRKNPIIRIRSGGKMLVRDLIQNSYRILESLS